MLFRSAAHQSLSAQFADHGKTGEMRRGYLAFVWGAPNRVRGTVDAPIDRHPHAREKMAVRDGGREAVTHWELQETFNGRDRQRCGKAGNQHQAPHPRKQRGLFGGRFGRNGIGHFALWGGF